MDQQAHSNDDSCDKEYVSPFSQQNPEEVRSSQFVSEQKLSSFPSRKNIVFDSDDEVNAGSLTSS